MGFFIYSGMEGEKFPGTPAKKEREPTAYSKFLSSLVFEF